MSISTTLPEEPRSALQPPPNRRWHGLVRAAAKRPELTAILLLAASTWVRIHGTVDPDVSWQLWIADRVHHGARLYRDIVEINPPLWFWMALPMDRAAHLLGVGSDAVAIATTALLAALSLVATGHIINDIPQRRRALLLVYAGVILFGMPWMHIGQREQMALIGAVPYAALTALRRSGGSRSRAFSLAVGAGAAVGFALKHYFLIVPALLELWLYVGNRRSWRLLRPEIVGLLIVGGAYACAMLIWARDFFSLTLPLIRLAYGTTGAPHFIQIFGPPIWIAFLILGFVAAHRRIAAGSRTQFATAFLVAGLGFGAADFIQSKGWPYHAIPFLGCVSLALASMLAEIPEAPRPLRLLGPALLALPLAMAMQEARAERLPGPELARAVADLPAGTSVGFLATEPAIAWSVTLQHHLRFASRYYGFWMIRAIVRNEHLARPDPRLEQLRHDIVRQTVMDFRCIAPQRIVVSRPSPDGSDADAFDILPFFLADPQFRELMGHYRPIGRGPGLDLYELSTPLQRPAESSCRRGV